MLAAKDTLALWLLELLVRFHALHAPPSTLTSLTLYGIACLALARSGGSTGAVRTAKQNGSGAFANSRWKHLSSDVQCNFMATRTT